MAEVRAAVLKLVGDMLDHGVKAGDMSPREGERVIPWNVSQGEVLRRIDEEMQRREDPLGYVKICWFGVT
ncbi:hypothetical protein ACFU99_27625 [Streptomyces sp. NPDC057654]|uniref:hypothetical protein n=1 Tax=Streptomyces sp. NPDC057654 TaxID=3346196 RepID=UPI0036C50645